MSVLRGLAETTLRALPINSSSPERPAAGAEPERSSMLTYRSQLSSLPVRPLAVGVLIRIVLAPYTSWNYDSAVWFQTSLAGFYGLHLYERPGFSYPPLWGYLLEIIGALVRLAGMGPAVFGVRNPDFSQAASLTGEFTTIVTSPSFNIIFKSVLFGADIATGLLIFRFVYLLTRDLSQARLAFTLWFLNPIVIYESAVHGAVDSLVGFLVLATVALAWNGRAFWCGLAWSASIMAKLSPLVLVLQLLLIFGIGVRRRNRSFQSRFRQLRAFAAGTLVGLLILLSPEIFMGSVSGLIHSVLQRTQGPLIVGGLTVFGIRHFRPWSWILPWAYENSLLVVRITLVAQAVATLAWAAWTFAVVRKKPELGLLVGCVGTLTTFTILSPQSNPQYVLWWLPMLIVLVVVTRRGYWQLVFISVAAVVFALGTLGPVAVLSPLATYTHVISAQAVSDAVILWYQSPGKLWGAYLSDDFWAPTSAVVVGALLSLYVAWLQLAMNGRNALPSHSTP